MIKLFPSTSTKIALSEKVNTNGEHVVSFLFASPASKTLTIYSTITEKDKIEANFFNKITELSAINPHLRDFINECIYTPNRLKLRFIAQLLGDDIEKMKELCLVQHMTFLVMGEYFVSKYLNKYKMGKTDFEEKVDLLLSGKWFYESFYHLSKGKTDAFIDSDYMHYAIALSATDHTKEEEKTIIDECDRAIRMIDAYIQTPSGSPKTADQKKFICMAYENSFLRAAYEASTKAFYTLERTISGRRAERFTLTKEPKIYHLIYENALSNIRPSLCSNSVSDLPENVIDILRAKKL
jgi:hypothetical protein